MSGRASASICRWGEERVSGRARRHPEPEEEEERRGTDREEQDLVPAGCKLCGDVVHGLAWLCPVCAEVEDRDASEVGGEELLEVGGRLDAVVVGRGGHGVRCAPECGLAGAGPSARRAREEDEDGGLLSSAHSTRLVTTACSRPRATRENIDAIPQQVRPFRSRPRGVVGLPPSSARRHELMRRPSLVPGSG